ncbi:response regulator transcription factor [Psychromonas aquimarina]|uniref:response regulator transcription factor n=1 Tax=Psychromonas aquimarina TaxID=444919 RepID=UPI00040DD1C2|nr:response regulator transcription factor [Psychromonas aquimarina]
MDKIVIIDDHQLFLHGLKLTLESDNNEVWVFDDPVSAVSEIEQIHPDIIIMDLYMPKMDGIAMLEQLALRNILSPVVVLSACEDYKDVLTAFEKGAMGFIPKSYAPQDMLDGLQRVLRGDIFIPPEIAVQLNSLVLQDKKNKEQYHLSPRQAQILELIHNGRSNREIADKLCISQDTVKFHQRGLYQILDVSGASSRAKAVEKALQLGLLKAH